MKREIIKLTPDHDFSKFDCGNGKANDYIKNKALLYQEKNLNVTWLLIENKDIIGFYTLSATSIKPKYFEDTASFPVQVPCILLGWMAVDTKYKGQNKGRILMLSAFKKTYKTSKLSPIGIKALKLEALNSKLIEYYKKLELTNIPNTNIMVITIQNIEAILSRLKLI
ncbi:hypothetical protein MY04_0798 [Flammeovirga sp. MY04]|nr:hypothetical protein [Flammeovirga sp. MY04]ANQ48180.1 hypothetical protein MY04_0798 [Flammeovirga sp. MY04]